MRAPCTCVLTHLGCRACGHLSARSPAVSTWPKARRARTAIARSITCEQHRCLRSTANNVRVCLRLLVLLPSTRIPCHYQLKRPVSLCTARLSELCRLLMFRMSTAGHGMTCPEDTSLASLTMHRLTRGSNDADHVPPFVVVSKTVSACVVVTRDNTDVTVTSQM